MSDQERRKSIRYYCENRWIEVSNSMANSSTKSPLSIKVRVHNLSETGVCLISSSAFELGQTLHFSESDMPALGTVVWTCQSRTECKAGIQFS